MKKQSWIETVLLPVLQFETNRRRRQCPHGTKSNRRKWIEDNVKF